MKKRNIMLGSVVLLVALLVAGGIMAWFTSTPEAVTNMFTAGTVEIQVNEHGFTDITNWNPGDTTTKEVSVKSLGSKKSYIRVALTPEWIVGENEEALPINNVILNLEDNDDWVKSGDWYYYKKIIEKGQETSLLLQSVTLVGNLTGDAYQGKTLKVVVKAEAVQASHEAYKTTWGLGNLPPGVDPYVAP